MNYFKEVYSKRLNRYGLDYQSRVQGQREQNFELLLEKSHYRIDFEYNNNIEPGLFERYKQDETETFQYLLTRIDLNIKLGTVLMIPNKDKILKPWMVYWLEEINSSGYNKYILLKMTHFITWTARDKKQYSTWAYMYGQQNNMLKDEIRSRSRSNVIYNENLKSSFFIMPKTEHIRKDDYLVVGEGAFKEGYRVTGYDINSSEGIEYVTIDPMYLKDETPAPIKKQEDNDEDFFWLEGE